MSLKIYVASSWRNAGYQQVVDLLGDAGHKVWNWRKPPTGGNGFKWQDAGQVDYKYGDLIPVEKLREMLEHPTAQTGFASDLAGMNWCDVGVLMHPCGRSAHLEAGWIAGRGKKVHVLALYPIEPDLMVLALGGSMCATMNELYRALDE